MCVKIVWNRSHPSEILVLAFKDTLSLSTACLFVMTVFSSLQIFINDNNDLIRILCPSQKKIHGNILQCISICLLYFIQAGRNYTLQRLTESHHPFRELLAALEQLPIKMGYPTDQIHVLSQSLAAHCLLCPHTQ